MPPITRSLHVWKATLTKKISFLGQGSNETHFSGCMISHMVISDLDKIAAWSSSGENAIFTASLYTTSVCATTSPVFVSRNFMLWDYCDFAAATFPESEILRTCRASVSSVRRMESSNYSGLGVRGNRSNKNSSVSRKDYEWVLWAGEHLQSFPFRLLCI